MRLSELAELALGELQGEDKEFFTVSIDSRILKPGDLFIAIGGQRFDGHDFVAQAGNLGATAAVVERRVDCLLPQVVVADARIALGKLGSAWRQACPVELVGLTGSNGKTTVKEMIASILAVNDKVLSTRGNLNNDLGVPLTLLGLTQDHRYAVIEMGANHLGEIAYVANLAQPDIAIITNAGEAHLEGFGSREGVARGKGEIISFLGLEGTAILNADDRFFGLWQEMAGTRKVVSFGLSEGASLRGLADSVSVVFDGGSFVTRFICEHQGVRHNLVLRLAGYHNVMNALAAVASCLALGVEFQQIREGLSRVLPVSGRVQPEWADNGALMINDTYNANPTSFEAALNVLLDLPGEPWVVLGAFGELGETSPSLHADLGILAKSMGIARLYTTGLNAENAAEAFGAGARFFSRQDELIKTLKQEIGKDVVLLVKGSRSQHMERVIEALKAGT